MNAKWAVTFAVLVAAALATPAPADTLYDLRDPSIDNIDGVSSFTLTVNGISATLTALVNGQTNAATVLNRTASGFGVNAVGSGDLTDQIDNANGIESVRLVFDQDVYFTQLVLAFYSTSTQVPPGDIANLGLPQGALQPAAMTSAIDTYNFSSNNFIAAGQAVDLAYVQGNGFSFNSFSVNSAVPLPTAALSGVTFLGAMAAGRFVRRRRAGQ
jgi:hypothetical protein